MKTFRIALIGAVALSAVALCSQNASAKQMEFCPAAVSEAHKLDSPSGALYSFDLNALSVRSVTGEVLADTDAGWFAFPFSNVALTADTGTYKNAYLSFSRTDYSSKELFVRFPASVTKIDGWWVDRAQATGDAFGWDAKGSVKCLPPAGTGLAAKPRVPHSSDVERTSPSPVDLKKMPGDGDLVFSASAAPASIVAACPEPATQAFVTEAVQPQWPNGWNIQQQITTLVAVAIAPDGGVGGAWVYQTSGQGPFDTSAVSAAERSTYRAGTAYCAASPGTYLFSATFMPH